MRSVLGPGLCMNRADRVPTACRGDESIRISAYNRCYGRVHFLVLRCGEAICFPNSGEGNYRTAAIAVLGDETIPAVFVRSSLSRLTGPSTGLR